MSGSQTVATIRENAVEEVRVALTSFNGHDLVDAGLFAKFDCGVGERKLTKPGVGLKTREVARADRRFAGARGGGTLKMASRAGRQQRSGAALARSSRELSSGTQS